MLEFFQLYGSELKVTWEGSVGQWLGAVQVLELDLVFSQVLLFDMGYVF